MNRKIERAILSVSDKAGVVELAEFLSAQGVELLSTGGTAKALRQAGLPVVEVSDYTGFPEMLDGRVKTLHPKIHGGLLARRDRKEDLEAILRHGIKPIDLVVVNLYPFERAVANPQCSFEDAVENIDIGGPSMLRAAAKNHAHVTVVVDPSDYEALRDEMKKNAGSTSEAFRYRCMQKVFSRTAAYDGAIANYFTARPNLHGVAGEAEKFPAFLNLSFRRLQGLRYGENPHQQGAFYSELNPQEPCLSNARQLHGKELSYNNILDLHAALEIAREFSEPAAVIVKHNNPCGVALATSVGEAYRKARQTDPTSAFGGIVALNRFVDEGSAEILGETFLEAILAPGFEPAARDKLGGKKNLRLLELAFEPGARGKLHPGLAGWDLRRVVGGLLIQDFDRGDAKPSEWKVVTKRPPSEGELRALRFAWTVCKHVKSNAVVFAQDGQLVGVGAGQMSRVDSTRLGAQKARLPLGGCVAASDAFFPFRDGLDEVAKAGALAVVQPGGSVRDEEVIAAADEHGMAMVFTGYRHFKH